ncbi:MAG: hypothetical protein FJ088_14610, partial [Deltaproteobacteria bacterium]|nr:hypothetical protein [Deltaproteobacteria bacterium]
MQNKRFRYILTPVAEGDSYPLKKNFSLVPFRAMHSIATCGAVIMRKKSKLRREYVSLPSNEIVKLKESGADIFIEDDAAEICYTSDTSIEIVEKNEFVRNARVLIIETTFLDSKKDIEKAHAGKHIHLDEVVPRAAEFNNELVILFHFSQIYTNDEIKTIIRERLPEGLRKKVRLLLPDERLRL